MNWDIPQISGESLQITLKDNDRLFIVGANGSGKSALIQHLASSNRVEKIRRISAHRQTWFHSGSIDFTPQSRREFDSEYMGREWQPQACWRDELASERLSALLFDLVAKENARARSITQHIDAQDTEKAVEVASESVSLFKQINELLARGRLMVSLKNADDEEILAQHRNTDTIYNLAQMSDGERNAVIIAATVLTVERGTILLIDEPERHLHRSIIEPFLSALFAKRMDCTFVVSTHETALPVANPQARVLMVRSYQWNQNIASAWDVEVLEANLDLPEDLKRAILGSRKKVLFVEGSPNSLDLPLYTALFPDISVVPQGDCQEVEKAVKGLRGSECLHHVKAFGLIDRDNRTEENIKNLAKDGIFALDVYSVESLYYCSDAIAAVARRQAESLGCNADEMIKAATQAALNMIQGDACLAERMAARRCEGHVQNQVKSQIPDWTSIKSGKIQKIEVCFASLYQEELERFRQLVTAKNLDDLVARYPLRESRVFDDICKDLKLKRDTYTQTLLTRIRHDNDLAMELKQRIRPLSEVLDTRN